METLYRKVAISERKPKSSGFYWIENIVGEMKSSYYDSMLGMFTSSDYANFWLKPAENPTAQLQADKAELLEALENIVDYGGIANFDTLKSLIQKMKKCQENTPR